MFVFELIGWLLKAIATLIGLLFKLLLGAGLAAIGLIIGVVVVFVFIRALIGSWTYKVVPKRKP